MESSEWCPNCLARSPVEKVICTAPGDKAWRKAMAKGLLYVAACYCLKPAACQEASCDGCQLSLFLEAAQAATSVAAAFAHCGGGGGGGGGDVIGGGGC